MTHGAQAVIPPLSEGLPLNSFTPMTKTQAFILGALLSIAIIIAMHLTWTGVCPSRVQVNDTTHITFYDTIMHFQPVPRDSIVVRYITERLPVSKGEISTSEGQGILKPTEIGRLSISDSAYFANQDSIDVAIPITQKIYEDSLYRAVVSGYRPRLDEISVYPRREAITITERAKPKRWGVGVQVGYGITIGNTPRPSAYIGIGVQYNIFSF